LYSEEGIDMNLPAYVLKRYEMYLKMGFPITTAWQFALRRK